MSESSTEQQPNVENLSNVDVEAPIGAPEQAESPELPPAVQELLERVQQRGQVECKEIDSRWYRLVSSLLRNLERAVRAHPGFEVPGSLRTVYLEACTKLVRVPALEAPPAKDEVTPQVQAAVGPLLQVIKAANRAVESIEGKPLVQYLAEYEPESVGSIVLLERLRLQQHAADQALLMRKQTTRLLH